MEVGPQIHGETSPVNRYWTLLLLHILHRRYDTARVHHYSYFLSKHILEYRISARSSVSQYLSIGECRIIFEILDTLIHVTTPTIFDSQS